MEVSPFENIDMYLHEKFILFPELMRRDSGVWRRRGSSAQLPNHLQSSFNAFLSLSERHWVEHRRGGGLPIRSLAIHFESFGSALFLFFLSFLRLKIRCAYAANIYITG